MRRLVVVAALLLSVTAVLSGQQSGDTARPSFEVASVKPNISGDSSSSIETLPGGTWRAANVSIRRLLLGVYYVQDSQIVGLPNWAVNERFNIFAKASRAASDPQLWAMMGTLLEDRFNLRTHIEQREGPVYFLSAARDDKRLGAAMVPVSRNCAIDSPTPREPTAPAAGGSFCGIDSNTGSTQGRIRGGGQTMEQLAIALGNYAVTRPIIDRTEIAGTFDFEVEWVPESARLAATAPTDGASIFTALQDLGLRLDAGRGPVPTLVVDRLERPTPD
jgi:uncharacterized protein (TIGR03435 family)